MPSFTTRDGSEIYYKDWGTGQPIVFSHGWPLTADAWEDQMVYLAEHGFRAIAHDRRGHGRSSQPWEGNHMDQYADDLAELFEKLDLRDTIMVGHSTGGGEVVRYLGRHGEARVAKAVLIAAVPPQMVESEDNPNGLPRHVFDDIRSAMAADRSQYLKDLTGPFFGANREAAQVSQGMRDTFWLLSMQGGLKNELDCIAAFSETNFFADLDKISLPVLIIHGDDDQIVPFETAGKHAAELLKNSVLKVYPGGAHALPSTEKDQINADLLEFARADRLVVPAGAETVA